MLISEKLAEAEEKIDRSTNKFLRVLKINYLTMGCFSIGILMVLYDLLTLKYVVMVYGLYDIALIFTIIQKALQSLGQESAV